MKHSRGSAELQEIFYLLSLETDKQLEIRRKRVLFVTIDHQNIRQCIPLLLCHHWSGTGEKSGCITTSQYFIKHKLVLRNHNLYH